MHRLSGGSVLAALPVRDEVHALAVCGDGRRLALGFRGRIAVYELPSGRRLFDRATHGRRIVWDLSFSPDGGRLATGGLDGTVRIFALPSGRPLEILRGKWPHVTRVRWLAGGAKIVSVVSNQRVRVHALVPRAGMYVLDPGGGAVRDLAFAQSGRRFYAACGDGRVRIYETRTGRLAGILEGGAGALVAVAVRAGDGAVLARTEGGRVLFWPRGETAPRVLQAGRDVLLARFLDGGGILCAGRAGLVRILSPDGTELRAERTFAGPPLTSAALHAGTGLLALARRGPRLEVVALDRLAMLASAEPASASELVPHPAIRSLAFDPQGGCLAAGGEDMVVRLCDARTLAARRVLKTMTPGPLEFSRDGRLLVVGGRHNPTVLLFDLVRGTRLYSAAEHGNRISSVAFSPAGGVFATASYDGSVHLRAAPGGALRAVLDAHRDAVARVRFDPSGRWLVSVSLDGTIRCRPVDPLPLARARLVRDFTAREIERLGSALNR